MLSIRPTPLSTKSTLTVSEIENSISHKVVANLASSITSFSPIQNNIPCHPEQTHIERYIDNNKDRLPNADMKNYQSTREGTSELTDQSLPSCVPTLTFNHPTNTPQNTSRITQLSIGSIGQTSIQQQFPLLKIGQDRENVRAIPEMTVEMDIDLVKQDLEMTDSREDLREDLDEEMKDANDESIDLEMTHSYDSSYVSEDVELTDFTEEQDEDLEMSDLDITHGDLDLDLEMTL